MSDRDPQHPRFQDLSREQAFGLAGRVLQRIAPLLIVKDGATGDEVYTYFSDLLEFTYLLCEIGLGNVSVNDARARGKEFHERFEDKSQLFAEKSVVAAEAIMLVTDALGDLGLIHYSFRPGLLERDKKMLM
jgi:hypothetical protein